MKKAGITQKNNIFSKCSRFYGQFIITNPAILLEKDTALVLKAVRASSLRRRLRWAQSQAIDSFSDRLMIYWLVFKIKNLWLLLKHVLPFKTSSQYFGKSITRTVYFWFGRSTQKIAEYDPQDRPCQAVHYIFVILRDEKFPYVS